MRVRVVTIGRVRVASCDGVAIDPRVLPGEWYEMDYSPREVAECRDRPCDSRRDLRGDETAALDARLTTAPFVGIHHGRPGPNFGTT